MRNLWIVCCSALLLLGCGAAHRPHVAAPSVPSAKLITTECLEVTTPPEWTLTKGETHRPPDAATAAETGDGPYSTLEIGDVAGHGISIIHPHGDGDFADYMFTMMYLGASMLVGSVPANRELFVERGITSMTMSDLVEVPTISGGWMFTVTMIGTDGNITEVRELTLLLNPSDTASRIIVSTDLPVSSGEVFPAQALTIIRSLRFLCGSS